MPFIHLQEHVSSASLPGQTDSSCCIFFFFFFFAPSIEWRIPTTSESMLLHCPPRTKAFQFADMMDIFEHLLLDQWCFLASFSLFWFVSTETVQSISTQKCPWYDQIYHDVFFFLFLPSFMELISGFDTHDYKLFLYRPSVIFPANANLSSIFLPLYIRCS